MRGLAGAVRGLSRWKLAVLAGVVIAALAGAASWGYTAWNQADVGAEGIRYRWVNVSIEAPASGDIHVIRYVDAPGMYIDPGAGSATYIPVIKVVRRVANEASGVMIDANTGEVVLEEVRPQDRAAFDAILDTLRFEGPDIPEDAWPYSATAAPGPRRQFDLTQNVTVSFFEPDPASGILVMPGFGDSVDRSWAWVTVENGRSMRAIDADTGQFMVDEQGEPVGSVEPADREAFDRLISSIELLSR